MNNENNTVLLIVVLGLGLGMVYLLSKPAPKKDPWVTLGGAIGGVVGAFI